MAQHKNAGRLPVLREIAVKLRGALAKKRKRASAQQSTIIRKIIRLEERVWKVAQDRDAVRFAELVPADAVMIFQSGIVTQPEYLATMKERTISRYELRNIRGFMPNATTALPLSTRLCGLAKKAARRFQ